MKDSIQVTGRTAFGHSHFKGQADPQDGVLVLRVDDENHPEFWLQVTIPVEQLERLLCAVRAVAYSVDKFKLIDNSNPGAGEGEQ